MNQTEINKALIIKELLDAGKITSIKANQMVWNEFLILWWTWINERTEKLRKRLWLKSDIK